MEFGQTVIYENSSDLAAFTVTKPEPLELFPTVLAAAASGATIAVVGVGLLVYFKKHKQ